MSYLDNQALRYRSSLRAVQDADDELLADWASIAQGEIDQFCNRDFTHEVDVEKAFWVTGPLIVCGKEVSNITAAASFDEQSNPLGEIDIEHDLLVIPPSNTSIRYSLMTSKRQPYPITPRLVKITANWGTASVPAEVSRVYFRLIERIAARSHEDDQLQMHAPYGKQGDGDGYDYDLGNATLRNLLRPEDRAQLWKWVNHGRLTA